ncbi:glutathione S-transferase family protein [Leeia oryzae]|uniref:glutathione S-transferase family protein n=1 Tax=Leeia oryzae TaxID=356662 RepID=UPI0003656E8D|nr:glutathione S-transferase family protein [Leeia oryzae]
MKHTMYHIPVCPFSQRLEILLTLKGCRDQVDFQVIDITKPRPDWLLAKTHGTTSLPVMELPDGRILKESLVLLQYLESIYPARPVAQQDPYKHAVESMMARMEGDFCNQGYRFVMNQNPTRQQELREGMLAQYAKLNDFLLAHSPDGTYLFDDFGWAETIFTPFFMRFWFLDYYEDFQLPDTPSYQRVKKWQAACLAHPAAQQVTREEIVKNYYDYAKGAGNGTLLPGRQKSSFVFEPHWKTRPWPPKDKYNTSATDDELGLNG